MMCNKEEKEIKETVRKRKKIKGYRNHMQEREEKETVCTREKRKR